MKIILLLLVFIILCAFFKKIRNFEFYFRILENSKYPLYNYISFKEKVAYYITRIVKELPTFSFAPSDYDYWKLKKERTKRCSTIEKVLLTISLIGLYLQGIIGNVLCILIIFTALIFLNGYLTWPMLRTSIITFFNNIFTVENGEFALKILKWIQDNVNALLIIVIVLISLYIGFLKRIKRKYSLEEIWAEEDAEKVRKVAKIQKELEDTLLFLRAELYENMNSIQEQIRLFSDDYCVKTEQIKDYSKITDKIKELLHDIVKVQGGQIYVQRNMRIYTQLTILEIVPLLVDNKTTIQLDRLSKDCIKKIVKPEKICAMHIHMGLLLLMELIDF